MPAPDYLFGSACALARAIASGALSAVEVVDAHLARIDEVNPRLNAVVTVAAERARAEACRADARRAAGRPLGVLHGVPVTLKDSFDTEGIRSTAGTEGRRHHVPACDATVVARLRASGAIVIGKTNTPELTMGSDTESPIFGRTSNPYHQDYTPAGSSGGSAAILAAGGSALDIGSDTGGSLREPAHVCGVVGLKPTAGRVPRTGHALPFGMGLIDALTQVGPMARYVEDVELALALIGGADGVDPSVAPVALGRSADVPLDELRVTYFTHNGLWEVHPAVAAATRAAVDALRSRVRSVAETVPAPIAGMGDLYTGLRTADGGRGLRRLLAHAGTIEPGPVLRRRIAGAEGIDTGTLADLFLEADRFRAGMHALLNDCDAIVSPPCPYTPWKHGSGVNSRYEEWSYCVPFNVCGWPAIVLRAGATADGLPVGVQIAAGPWREDIVVALAAQVERACGGYRRPAY